MNAGDWDRDGDGDILIRHTDGTLRVNRGNGTETFATGVIIGRGFGSVSVIDVRQRHHRRRLARPHGPAHRRGIRVWPGRGTSALAASYVAHSA